MFHEKTYNQFNLPNQNKPSYQSNNVYTPETGNPITPDQTWSPTSGYSTPTNEYIYPQSLTVVTAWDRTGLDNAQILEYEEGDPAVHYRAVCIGDDITTYSSAKSTQLIAGSNFNCTRYLYPSSQQEKSFYLSTSSLKEQQILDTSSDQTYFNITDPNNTITTPMEICNLKSDPSCPFKPTFLLGIMSVEDLNYEGVQEHTTLGIKNKINPVLFNLEFDIGVTFRGLRKSQVV